MDSMQAPQKPLRPIWLDESSGDVNVIDQRSLPHELVVLELQTVDDTIYAIQEMVVRGAPLIGITAAYGVYLAVRNTPADAGADYLPTECERIKAARPTAVNLQWAVDRVTAEIDDLPQDQKLDAARRTAGSIAEEEAENCRLIGHHGLRLIEAISERKNGRPVNILTHCNAGWPPSPMVPPPHRSIPPMIRISMCTSGSMKPDR